MAALPLEEKIEIKSLYSSTGLIDDSIPLESPDKATVSYGNRYRVELVWRDGRWVPVAGSTWAFVRAKFIMERSGIVGE